jgi:hypothetical protein
MSVLGAFPGEICWIEVWIDMWALERLSEFEDVMRGRLRACINSAPIVVGSGGPRLLTELMDFGT